MHPIIHQCPVCSHALHARKLQCANCDTTIENEFALSSFSQLSKEQLQFVEVFLVSRGNIKEVEKALDLSYPTVRAKLNDVIAALGYDEKEKHKDEQTDILAQLEAGDITVEEAKERLQ